MQSIHSNTEQIADGRLEAAAEAMLAEGLARLGIELDEAALARMVRHLALLSQWNRRLNLTAITAHEQMVINHSLDSLTIAPWLQGQRILDIGSGGGFPGMPLATVFPERQVTLLDSRGKRVEFLRHVSTTLGLSNISLVKSRVEDYRPETKFDTLVTRAFSSLRDMLCWSKGLQIPGTRLVAMKGRIPDDEIAGLTARQQQILQVVPLEVPGSNAERHAIIFDF